MSVELRAPQISLITVTRENADDLTVGIRNTLNRLPDTFHIKDIEYAVSTKESKPIYSALIIGTVLNGDYIDMTESETQTDPQPQPDPSVQETLDQLTSQLTQLQSQYTQLQSQYSQLESRINESESKIDELEAIIQSIQNG